MRKVLLFENVNGNSEKVQELIWKQYKEVKNVSIKFLPLKHWQKGLSLRVGGQHDGIDAFVRYLKKSGFFFRQLENIRKINPVETIEESWEKIGKL